MTFTCLPREWKDAPSQEAAVGGIKREPWKGHRECEQRAAENKHNTLEGTDAAAHVSRIRTSDFTGLTDNQGLIILGVSQRVIFSEGNYLKNNFCHTGCPCVRRACLCATLLIWK